MRTTTATKIEFPITLPVGGSFFVSVDRDLGVDVFASGSAVPVASAGWNYGVSWFIGFDDLGQTSLEMVAARVESVVKLFERGDFGDEWLSPRARFAIR
jgi:hypothetical protein